MHSLSQRANTIVCFGGIVLVGVLLLNVFSRAFFSDHVDVDIKLNEIHRFNTQRNFEYSFISIDLDANLEPLFNWNTKMLFLYVTAEYRTKQNVLSQVVVWDHILTEKSKANIHEKRLSKYPIIDQGLGLKNNTIKLTFNYNVVPISGILTRHQVGSSEFKFPTTYMKEAY
ncbi:hypothetical protein ACTFIY_001026 [Dictyostelium cf. discoideum]